MSGDRERDGESGLKSLNYDWPAYLTFINRTGHPVDIAWLDYRGNIVRYRRELASGGLCHQNTFVTHPWIAWNARTLERATFSGETHFLPQPWRGEQHRTVVFIDRPVNSLLQLCLQTVRDRVKTEDVERLEIPKDLHDPLRQRRRIDFVDYIGTYSRRR